jgi:hypothetical protein
MVATFRLPSHSAQTIAWTWLHTTFITPLSKYSDSFEAVRNVQCRAAQEDDVRTVSGRLNEGHGIGADEQLSAIGLLQLNHLHGATNY